MERHQFAVQEQIKHQSYHTQDEKSNQPTFVYVCDKTIAFSQERWFPCFPWSYGIYVE